MSDVGWDVYQLPVLDTLYVRKPKRRRGFGAQLVKDFLDSHPTGDVGISTPISEGLLKGKSACGHFWSMLPQL